GRGPSLVGVFGSTVKLEGGGSVTADEAYLRESMLNPMAKIVAGYQPQMPTQQGLVSEEQLVELVAYLKSLSPKGQPGAPGAQAAKE
ncbi:MAG: c-type cytochrome, partial [Vicinamibacterales bacterium]